MKFKGLYRISKGPSPIHIQSQIHPIHEPIPFLKRPVLILSSYPHQILLSGLISSGFKPQPSIYLSPPSYTLHVPPIQFFLIWSPELYLVMSR